MDFHFKNLFGVIIFAVIILGCSYDIKSAEEFSGIKLKNNVIIKKDTSYWNDFNGNGFKYVVFEPKDEQSFKLIINNAKSLNFKKFNANQYPDPELRQLLKNGKGYFKFEWHNNETKTFVIDTVNKKIIYYYVVM